ncbi:MAG TPA: glutaredoxin domain-containing protein [Acidimicrobiales bacterium]|jgi:glutaredoxin|nr:glutaredoxin domain-containing protein [Acidimicrobiales bacterium]MDP6241478.1 glutaredoxin domain-containing protein [Acidimicrobiales bacterium]MDP7124744.1 glutaredoxin domain-containing protein [Acidimicrobiales bacterium]MDP7353257.1 glutaredoxin domain-containing protein [Acidimicrobiales bacterium]MEE1565284.1 glutaredoxin domain-containing protein [Acidimicrobiales bacterium]|tara:strand:+ start:5375 stop:5626 length:252 start_codon:yes stop_codon:yes gene_type:complete
MATGSDVTVYWRPGCGFCHKLFQRFDRAGIERTEHNIWEDPEARTYLRTVTGGNETVPTVVVGGQILVNPRPEEVVALVELGL